MMSVVRLRIATSRSSAACGRARGGWKTRCEEMCLPCVQGLEGRRSMPIDELLVLCACGGPHTYTRTCTILSLVLSNALVASSSSKMGGSFRIALGMPMPGCREAARKEGVRGGRHEGNSQAHHLSRERWGARGACRSYRAIAMRWRCPPESMTPISPTSVSAGATYRSTRLSCEAHEL
jgi:hypothetical protein